MREMKDSGVIWIGEIPSSWKVSKLKYLFGEGDDGLKIGPFGSAMKGKTLENGPYKIYNQAHLISNDFSLDRHFVSEETFEELKNYEVKPGDVLFSMMGTIGKCQIMPFGYPKGIMDSHLLKAGLKNTILPKFLLYAYDKDNSPQAISQLLYASNGTIMNGLNSSILKSVIIALPPVEEQQKIIKYLDAKCSKIDAIIAKQGQIIEKLKENRLAIITEAVTVGLNPEVDKKNSGIEWVSEIPVHWGKIKLKYASYIRARLGWKGLKADEYVEEGYPLLSAFNIVNSKIDFENNINYINQERYDESPEIMLSKGDILLVKDGAGIGKCGIVEELPMASTTNGSLAVITTNERLVPKYLYYYFLSAIFQQYIDRIKDGMGVPHLFQSDLKEIEVVVPNKYEQNRIVEFLDQKVSIIDEKIEKI